MDREYIKEVMESTLYVLVPHDLFTYVKPFTACVFSYIYGLKKKNMVVYGGNKKIAEIFCVSEETVKYRFNLEVQHCCAKIVRIFVSGKNNPIFV